MLIMLIMLIIIIIIKTMYVFNVVLFWEGGSTRVSLPSGNRT